MLKLLTKYQTIVLFTVLGIMIGLALSNFILKDEVPLSDLAYDNRGERFLRYIGPYVSPENCEVAPKIPTSTAEWWSDDLVTVPKQWISHPGGPLTTLAYITDPEIQLLKKLDLHGSGVDKHDHFGPGSVPSYNDSGGMSDEQYKQYDDNAATGNTAGTVTVNRNSTVTDTTATINSVDSGSSLESSNDDNWPPDRNESAGGSRNGPYSNSRNLGTISRADVTAALAMVDGYLSIAGGMTTAQARAYSANLSGAEKLAFEVARGEVTGRGTIVGVGSVSVEACSNGLGGDFLIVDPPNVDPQDSGCIGSRCNEDKDKDKNTEIHQNKSAVCRYLLANGKAGNVNIDTPGNVQLSWQFNNAKDAKISPRPGTVKRNAGSRRVNVEKDTTFKLQVSNEYGKDSCAVHVNVRNDNTDDSVCTNSHATNYLEAGKCIFPAGDKPTVVASIEALVKVKGGIYSGLSRYVSAGKKHKIYLRWQGVQSDGHAATYCEGVGPDDFAAPGHAALGSFETGDGRATPYPGLADGESRTFSVRCYNDFGSDTDYLTLTGLTNFGNVPPTITANGEPDRLIVKHGQEVEVDWNPGNNSGCTLSNNLTGIAAAPGSEDVTIFAESNFVIDCGAGGSDSVKVMSVAALEES